MNEAREIPILQISEQNPVSGDIQMRQLLELILQQIEFETNLPETWTEPNNHNCYWNWTSTASITH